MSSQTDETIIVENSQNTSDDKQEMPELVCQTTEVTELIPSDT